MQDQPNQPNQPTVIIAFEYPSVAETIRELLNKNNFKSYETNVDLLLNNPQPADLVLFCPQPPDEICEKAVLLYPGKVAVFVFSYSEKKYLPPHLQERVHLISLDQHLPPVLKAIQRLTKQKTKDISTPAKEPRIFEDSLTHIYIR